MEALWTPLFSFAVFVTIFAIGDIVASKTKAIISAVIVGSVVYIVGFMTGIIPTDSVDNTGLPTVTMNFIVPLLIVNLGTMIHLEEFLREWKTVLIALAGLIGVAVVAFTIGTLLFGRERAILGSAPISGGTIAAVIASDAALEMERGDLAAYVMLLLALQLFVGMPIASFMLKREAKRLLKEGLPTTGAGSGAAVERKIDIRLIKSWPKSMQSSTIMIAKLAIVAVISVWLSNLTKFGGTSQMINQNVMFLIMGILFCELGFLDKTALQAANAFGFTMVALYSIMPGSYKTLDLPSLLNMIWPLVGLLVLCAVGICVLSLLVGKLLKISIPMSAAIGVCCLFGYPCTQIVTNEVVASLDATDAEKDAVRDMLMPKMIVSGFTTVTIASVIFAGIVVPTVFM